MESSSDEADQRKKRKLSPSYDTNEYPSKILGIDDEADESERDSSSATESSDEEGENDGFVKDDDSVGSNEDTSSDSEEESPRVQLKKLRKMKDTIKLDEEDELLLQEQALNDIQAQNDNKFKGNSQKIKRSALDSDDEDNEEISPSVNKRGIYHDEDEGSDLEGFLADEGDDEDLQDGGGSSYKAAADAANSSRAKPAVKFSSQAAPSGSGRRKGGPTYDQIQEAVSIFGEGYDDFDDEDDELFKGGDDDAGAAVRAAAKDAAIETKALGKIRSKFDHSQIVALFGTARDDELRATDIPERLQECGWMQLRDEPDLEERVAEAQWIAGKVAEEMLSSPLFAQQQQPGTSKTVAALQGMTPQRLQESLVSTVEFTLKCIQVRTKVLSVFHFIFRYPLIFL
jgi:transcription elongation factor SPT6